MKACGNYKPTVSGTHGRMTMLEATMLENDPQQPRKKARPSIA
jgi:hypothetical protein